MANDIKQDIELGITDEKGKRAVLQLKTAKSSRGGIQCSCTVFWTDGQWRSTVLFGDYHAYLATTDKRATQKAIDTQHELVFSQAEINLRVAAAKEYYAKKDTPERAL